MLDQAHHEPSFIGWGDFVYRDGPPPVFTGAKGCSLTDEDGFRYLDAEAANGAAILGYDTSILEDALEAARAMPGLPSFCESRLRLDLAADLNDRFERATGVKGRVCFDLGGGQGIELALKIARMNGAADGIAVFEGSYHGRTPFTAHLSASVRYRATSPVLSTPIHRLPFPGCRQCRFGQHPSTCRVECLEFARTSLASEICGVADPAGRGSPGVFLFEPILNVAGIAVPDARYLVGLVEEFRARGALIVVDEIFTGLYRTGSFLALERLRIAPDIVVVSKGLTNGMAPLSCVWARNPLLTPVQFPPGTHSITYGSNPLSQSIARAVLGRLTPEFQARARELERSLAIMGERLAAHPLVVDCVAIGGILRVALQRPVATQLRQRARLVARAAAVDGYHGVLIASTGVSRDTIALHPPLTISEAEIAIAGQLLLRSLDEVAADG